MINKKISSLFLIIWLGDFFSTIGSGLTAFSLGVYVFKLTGLATSTATVVLFSFLPAFLLRPIGGVLADRIDRLLLMVIGNLGSALCIGLIFIELRSSTHNLGIIYLGLALSSIFYALQNPAYRACVSDFLPKELYAKASGLVQLSSSAQFLVSPLVGGILISMMSIRHVLFIDMLTFIFSAATVIFVRVTKNTRVLVKKHNNNYLAEIMEGWRAISTHHGIRNLIILISLLLFYIGLIQTLLAPMVLSFTNAVTLGFVQSVCAIGMLISSLIISTVDRKRNNVSILIISLITIGIFYSFIGIHENIWAIIIPGFLFFSAIPYVNSSIEVLIRNNISNALQARAWSLISLITYIGPIFAYVVAGFLADRVFNPLFMPGGAFADNLGHIFGVGQGRGIAFIFFLSGIFILIITIFIYRSKSIWQLERSENVFVTTSHQIETI